MSYYWQITKQKKEKNDEGQTYAILEKFQKLRISQGPSALPPSQRTLTPCPSASLPLSPSTHSPPPPPGTRVADRRLVNSGYPGAGRRSEARVPTYTRHRESMLPGDALKSVKCFLHKEVTSECFLTGLQRVDTLSWGLKC